MLAGGSPAWPEHQSGRRVKDMTGDTSEPLLRPARRRFKPYPAYKDSGVEWLGQLPSHWSLRKWRYCCHVTQGQVPPDDDRYRDRIMIAPNHIESGTGRILFTETADEQGATSGKYMVKPGDIIYSKIRPALNKACIATGHWLCSADMYPVAISTADLTPKYLLYFILSGPFVRLMVDESMRVAMPKVNRETVSDCPLLIPPLEEQESIVRLLDRETARIDGLVAKKERLIELLQEKRAALITRAVTKGLDPSAPMKDSGVEWLGQIPAHWEVKRLRDIAASLQTGPFGSQLHAAEYVSGGCPVINPVNLRDGCLIPDWNCTVDEHTASRLERHTLLAGDIIFARRGELGRCGLVTSHQDGWICGTGSLRLRPLPELSRPEFLLHSLSTRGVGEWLELQSVGATMLNLNGSIIGRIPIGFPPMNEQEEIVSRVSNEIHRSDTLVAKVREAIGRLKELRTALISAAVTGKIDVRAA